MTAGRADEGSIFEASYVLPLRRNHGHPPGELTDI